MKTCILTYNLNAESGGGGRYSAELVAGLRSRGVDVVVLQEIPFPGGVVVLRRGWGILRSAIGVYPYLKECDLVHALDLYPFGIIAWIANIFARKPLIITAIGTYSVAPIYNLHTSFLARSAYRSASAVIAISKYTAEKVSGYVAKTRLHIITPGINVLKFYRQIERDIVPRQIISVGALKNRKGYHVALRAFAEARKTIPDLKYVFVGDQRDVTYFGKLKQICRELNIESAVSFRQGISDQELKNLYESSGLFVLTSLNEGEHFEGFGIVLLEAASVGLPVIGTLDNGIKDAIDDGNNGFLVPQGDVQKTSQAIVKILNKPELWQKMSKASYEWAKKNNVDDSIKQYVDIYKSVLWK